MLGLVGKGWADGVGFGAARIESGAGAGGAWSPASSSPSSRSKQPSQLTAQLPNFSSPAQCSTQPSALVTDYTRPHLRPASG